MAFGPHAHGRVLDCRIIVAFILEEVCDRHTQSLGNSRQHAGAQAVRARLVFLQLLMANAEFRAKLGQSAVLRDAQGANFFTY